MKIITVASDGTAIIGRRPLLLAVVQQKNEEEEEGILNSSISRLRVILSTTQKLPTNCRNCLTLTGYRHNA